MLIKRKMIYNLSLKYKFLFKKTMFTNNIIFMNEKITWITVLPVHIYTNLVYTVNTISLNSTYFELERFRVAYQNPNMHTKKNFFFIKTKSLKCNVVLKVPVNFLFFSFFILDLTIKHEFVWQQLKGRFCIFLEPKIINYKAYIIIVRFFRFLSWTYRYKIH